MLFCIVLMYKSLHTTAALLYKLYQVSVVHLHIMMLVKKWTINMYYHPLL